MDSDSVKGMFNKPVAYSCSANELILLIGTSLLLLILLSEFFDFTTLFNIPQIAQASPVKSRTPSSHTSRCTECPNSPPGEYYEYGYEDYNGPAIWKCKFPEATGRRQSPVNISCKNAIVCPSSPMHWSCEYTTVPSRIRMMNDGHCVVLQFRFPGGRPSICGGALKNSYDLYNVRFRWGPTDDEGSEHTIDYKRFAMEMQSYHVKSECMDTLSGTRSSDRMIHSHHHHRDLVVAVSYVFHVTTIDNPYLEPIITKLDRIKYAGCTTSITPFPLCWLMPAFISDYYMYTGSLTHPPCSEGVHWIVQPEPLAVSPRQVRKFRKLVTEKDGKMLTNTRPIQCLNNREVFYYTSDN